MASIAEYLRKILSARKGEEVRGSIHDSIKAMNDQIENDLGGMIEDGNEVIEAMQEEIQSVETMKQNGDLNMKPEDLTEAQWENLKTDLTNYYKRYESIYTTTQENEINIPINISQYNTLAILEVYIEGRMLNRNEYAINGTNSITLNIPLSEIGTKVHFIVYRSVNASNEDLNELKGPKGDSGAIVFNTIAEMKADEDLQVGDTCQTLGYYSTNDGGMGLYKIVDDDTLTEDSGNVHNLINGLKAILIVEDDKINIKQYGAKGNAQNDDTLAFTIFNNSNYKKLIIPEGTYNVTDILNISNKEIIGINKPIINCISQTTTREHQIQLNNSCILNNIKFVQNHQTSLMGLFNCYDAIIKNCELKVNNYKTNGYLDLYTNNKNITIENNIFDCYSAEQGGGIWIREHNSELVSSNIKFIGNRVKHYSTDECIGVWNWNGKVEDVFIDSCIFEDYEDTISPHFITLAVDELLFSNNIIYRNGITATASRNFSIVKFYYNTQYASPSIENCLFYLDTPLYLAIFNGGTPKINNCKIYNNYNCKINDGTSAENARFNNCYFEIEKFQLIKGIFKNCTFKCTNNNTSIQQYGQISRGNIELYDCIFIDMLFRGFFFQAFSANDSIVMNNVKFQNPDVTNLTGGNFISNGSNAVYTDIRNSDIIGKIAGGNSIGYILNNYLWQALTEFSGIKYNNNYVII